MVRTPEHTFQVIHTPGHTPEHIAFLVTDHGSGATEPIAIATGDFVFVGDLGRPDLLETAAGQTGAMEPSARRLYETVGRLGDLPDFVQVWPAHGAGSACGKALGARVIATARGADRLAVAAAHGSEVVHGDLKPSNLIWPAGGMPRLVDFGASKILGLDRLTATGEINGTPAYMAPEVLTGKAEVDHRIDVYGLGVVLYEMFTGRRAFEGTSSAAVFDGILNRAPTASAELNRTVPAELERIHRQLVGDLIDVLFPRPGHRRR